MEKKEVEGDVYVLNGGERVVKGEDRELKGGVDEVVKEVDGKK